MKKMQMAESKSEVPASAGGQFVGKKNAILGHGCFRNYSNLDYFPPIGKVLSEANGPKMNGREYPDVIKTILARPKTGSGGGIPLTRGEVAMLFLDGYAGDFPGLLDIRSQGYGEDDLWDGLTTEDVLEDADTVFVWEKWEPLELWPD